MKNKARSKTATQWLAEQMAIVSVRELFQKLFDLIGELYDHFDL